MTQHSFSSADATGSQNTAIQANLKAMQDRIVRLQADLDAATADFNKKKLAYEQVKAAYDTNYADKRRQNELKPQVMAAGSAMDAALAVMNNVKDNLKSATDEYERALKNAEAQAVINLSPEQRAQYELTKAQAQAAIAAADKAAGGKKLLLIIVGIGLGLVALGTAIYLIKKGKAAQAAAA
ncbi:MAG TPA: hypothetical protein PKZ07_14690 [Sedimentisphaerales bacterium]|nr:hypothetical protein [Sedimentisphaerales bacterium]